MEEIYRSVVWLFYIFVEIEWDLVMVLNGGEVVVAGGGFSLGERWEVGMSCFLS